jgi:UDP-N-acetylmuramate--alanine ligase
MKYYLIGIKGSGMSSLAGILFDLGYEVCGYDDDSNYKYTEAPLIERGIKIYYDQSYPLKDEIVVYSPAFKPDHKEMIRANNLRLKTLIYNQMLGELTKVFETIAVCGCHGKTTTTSVLAHVLNNIIGTNYLIGDGSGYAKKENKHLIIEACEYYRHFLDYYPKTIIITNIELDHVDYYKDLDDIKSAYVAFANQASNQIVACGDDNNIRSVSNKINKPIYYYGINDNNDFRAVNIISTTDGSAFDVYYKDKFIRNFKIKHYGKHMILNSLGAIAVAYLEGLDMDKVADNLITYEGAIRRFNETFVKDMVIIDDFAHHPTEIKAVIDATHQKYPNKKVIAVFEPHTFSRTKALYKEVVEALNTVDKSYILDIYPSREKQEDYPDITSSLIIDSLKNGESINIDKIDKLLQYHDSVILLMSPADLHSYIEKLIKLLNENR